MKTITVKAHIDLDEVQRVYDELTEGEDWQHEAICIRHPIMKTDSYALEAHDLALWLSTLKRLLVKESKRSKAQSKCCDATIVVRGSWYECEACGEVVTAEPTMTKDERGEIRANLDAPRWKCVACGHMEKGHLTSAAQGGRACPECGKRHFWTGGFKEAAAHGFSPRAALRRALDTIDALEAKLELQPCPECEGKGGEVSGFGPGGADREYCECPFCDDRLELPALEIEAIKHKWDAEHSDLFKFEAERDRDQWRERAERAEAALAHAKLTIQVVQSELSLPPDEREHDDTEEWIWTITGKALQKLEAANE